MYLCYQLTPPTRFFLFFFFMLRRPPRSTPLSLHDALPIFSRPDVRRGPIHRCNSTRSAIETIHALRSEEHTSELQSHSDLVCRLLLEKKKNAQKCVEYLPNRAGTEHERD